MSEKVDFEPVFAAMADKAMPPRVLSPILRLLDNWVATSVVAKELGISGQAAFNRLKDREQAGLIVSRMGRSANGYRTREWMISDKGKSWKE